MKKIAFIGIRGIPVVYSGFESFVEDLTENMKGFDFYVYCRGRYVEKRTHNKVSLIYIHTIYIYKLETFVHSLLSTIHAVFFLHPQIIFYLSVGNAPFMLLPKLFGIKTIINVDGMDWEREKWGKFGKMYLSYCAYLSTRFADKIVTDSSYSQEYYKKRFNINTTYIPYMVNGYKWNEKKEVLKQYKLQTKNYFVWAGRLVPDNHLEDLLTAFRLAKIKKKLVLIGDDNYKTQYLQNIGTCIKGNREIVKTGFLPRDKYLTLIKNSYAYIETKQSGGTHPTFLDALFYAPKVICNDFLANKNIAKNKCYYYPNRDILGLKKILLKNLNLKKDNFQSNKMKLQDKNILNKYKNIFLD